MAENENTNITPEHTLTDEEIAAQDQARKARKQRALRHSARYAGRWTRACVMPWQMTA